MPRQKKQHLKKRPDGRYCCVYHGMQFMGHTEDEALQKREEYKRNEHQEYVIHENPTVSQYAERWLPVAKAGLRFSSYNVNLTHLTHLCNVIGSMRVKDVKPIDIKRVYSTEYLHASGEYISHARALFVLLFGSAVDDGLLKTNPAKSDTAKPHKAENHSHRAITNDERAAIESAKDHRMYAPAIVMLYAGLRPQEVKALHVERDVDFENGIIHVRSSVHLVRNNHYVADSTGKTKNAIRDVPLFAPVRDALQGKSGYLIATPKGNVATRSAWVSAWNSFRQTIERNINGCQKYWYGRTRDTKAQAKAGTLLPYKEFTVVPYDLRHSFATWCRDNGVELHTCVEWMGHADAQMILKIYDEVTNTRSKSEAEKLEKMLIDRQNDMQAVNQQPGDEGK